MAPYFIFNNILSQDYLTIDKLPSIFKAQKDIQKLEILGRDGFLTQDNGSYKGVTKPVECWVKNLDDIDFLCSWLTGSGLVIFSNEPDKCYRAVIINQEEFSKVIREFHKFTIQFDCQPHKYSKDNNLITLTSLGTLFNPGIIESKPIIKIYGSGSIMLDVNGNMIYFDNVIDSIIINSEIEEALDNIKLMNDHMKGYFPTLVPGNNVISWTGTVTKIEITPQWRWL